MPVDYTWHDDEKTILHYQISGDDWNWTDFHRSVRMSMFSLVNLDHQVHVLADFREATRLPGGAVAHLRSIGKPTHQNFSGRAVILGLDDETHQKVAGGADKLDMPTHSIHFTGDFDTALARLSDDAE